MNDPQIRIAPSLRWILLGRGGQVLLQVIGISILARMIPPAEFGLLALAGVATTLLRLFLDMGTAAAIVQKMSLPDEQINSIFWFNVALGILISLFLCAAAPWIGAALGNTQVQPVLDLLAIAFPITALGATQVALLERSARFKTLAIQGLSAGLAGLAGAVVLAQRDYGVYALVAQSILVSTVTTVLAWRSARWKPRAPSLREIPKIASFSGNLLAFNLLNYLHRNSDTVIIGRVFGQADLGAYNVAYRILLFPLQNVTFAISKALLPAYSRRQRDRDLLREHYLLTLRGISLVTAPLMASIWCARDSLVLLLLGSAWVKAVPVIAWLAPVGFLQSIISTSGSVLASMDRTSTLRTLGLVGVPFLSASFIVGIPWGIEGVAASYCIANVIWLFPVLTTVMDALGGSGRSAIRASWPPAAMAAISFAGATFISNAVSTTAIGHLLTLVASGSAIYGAALRIFFWRQSMSLARALFAPAETPSR